MSGKVIMNTVKDVTFIWVTAKDFMHVGTSYLFNMARELQPAVLFIEDVDRCLKGTTLDTIKTEMDGMNPNDGILTILSTNFPDELPATLIDRPGRFDDVIEFNLPAPIERFKILKLYSKKISNR
jgi:SpoVK/Ycf46/Vps4 family AAA+-type ATPase